MAVWIATVAADLVTYPFGKEWYVFFETGIQLLSNLLLQLLDGGGSTFDANHIATDNSGVRLVDINGDGRADWIYINPDTSTEIYINQRGSRDDGKGLKPHWVKVEQDIEGWPDDKSINRTHILFGRVFGSGRADLIRIEELKSTSSAHDYKFHYHRNTGEGGTKVKGDGVHYCDMFGRGYDEYVPNEFARIR